MLRRTGTHREFLVRLACLALLTAVAWAQPQTSSYRIDTLAGGFAGDGGPAVAARLNLPYDVAVDSSGNLYITDRNNHRIRKVDSTGTITTIAGTGKDGFSGDGGPASQAQLNFPTGVAVDGEGNLYIADAPNDRIRKVDSIGTITTIAGTGEQGFSGDGGPASQAQLDHPRAVAVDGEGNLYIADRNNNRIRKVDSTGTITTIAGGGGFGEDGGPATQVRLNLPYGVAVDGTGNLYIADTNSDRIRKVDSTGTITTIAGTGEQGFSGDGGPATQASLNSPFGVAVDGAGNLYIADQYNNRIRRVDSTGTITTIAGTEERGFGGDGGPATQAPLFLPTGVAVDVEGNLYIADQYNNRIRRVDSTGTITTIAGTGERRFGGDGGPAIRAQLDAPSGVAVDGEGNLYIADASNHRIRKVDSIGTITTIAGTGEQGFGGNGGSASQAHLFFPTGVAVDGAGNLYIADVGNHRIRKVDSTGTITTIAGTGERGFGGPGGPAVQAQLDAPSGVAVDEAGNLYIADQYNHRIRRVDSTGTITTIAGTEERGFSGDGGPAIQARLSLPYSVAVDSAGNLYIADVGNHRIRRVDSTGTITTIAGTGELGLGGDGGPAIQAQLGDPTGVAVDSAGNLYIADQYNNRIRRVDSTGTITTIAGTGERGFSGDDGPAIQAQLDDPTGVAVDGAGNLYIADASNHRIRLLTPTATGSSLDFAHFANGTGITSSLVLVNVATHPIRPTLYFYDKEGDRIDPESVVDVMGDLEVTEDGALSVRTEMEPLGELTISTHGQGEVVSGSVKVVSNGPIGGFLRFDLPGIGVAGVGASPPVRDAIFPARRQAGGIRTAAALHNLGEEAITVSCRLMSGGIVLEAVEISLEANGQEARYIEEVFTATDTSDFVGSVRCTAPGLFTGIAVELDDSNRIFTTLPVVPVARTGGGGQGAGLDFAHFANGDGIVSGMVFVNLSTQPSGPGPTPFHTVIRPTRPVLYFYDKGGNLIDPESVVDLTGDLEITGDGALSIQTEMEPLGELTISTHGRGALVSGSVKVVSEGPIGGVLRYALPGIGVTGVGASPPVRDALFPVRQEGGLDTAAAIRNLTGSDLVVTCRLMKDGAVLEETQIPLAANGQEARYIEEMFTFTGADRSDFVGSVRCTVPPGEAMFTGVAVELDAANRIFTTLPVVPVQRAADSQE